MARVLVLIVCAVAWIGCASGGGGSATAESEPAKSAPAAEKSNYSAPPAGSALAKVEVGMNDSQVRKILGEPDDANGYMTGKAWIPWYFGSDTHRTDWMYKGKGRVVFSRNRYSGALKVINVLHNPNE